MSQAAGAPAQPREWSQRLLALLGDAPADAAAAADIRVVAFTRALLLYSAARAWIAAIRLSGGLAGGAAGAGEADPAWQAGLLGLVLATALTLLFGLSCSGSGARRRLAVRAALVPLAIHLAWTFPLTDNHFFLELAFLVVLACLQGEDALQALRFVVVIVLFHTGLQKLLWGHYWHGDFLAFMIATGSPFGDLFGLILPATEIERLRAMTLLVDGAGPYRSDSLALHLAANAVVLAELSLPVLLVLRRTRSAAAAVALALVAGLQLGAREVLFFALFSTGLCLFLPRDPLARALPWLGGFYLLLIAVVLGIVPDGGLLRGGHL